MYSKKPNFIIGFHSCDETLKNDLINCKTYLLPKDTSYHWLGYGVYFWENNFQRAVEYAEEIRKKPHPSHQKIVNPSVVGAIIHLGNCLDLLDSKSIELLRIGYQSLKGICEKENRPLNENTLDDEGGFPKKRELDCAVINTIHEINRKTGQKPFDSVRGVFFEGGLVYPGASFYNKTHIQICIKNPNCIKGFFNPLKKHPNFDIP